MQQTANAEENKSCDIILNLANILPAVRRHCQETVAFLRHFYHYSND
jgi:hypothetical protein